MEEINRLHDIADDIGSTSWGYELASALHNIAADIGEKVDEMLRVLDADGVEVHKGDDVWSTTGEFDGKRTVSSVHIDPDEPPYAMFEERQKPYSCLCCYLTHRAPVIAADGEPLEVGQKVWGVEDGKEFEVVNVNGELPLLKYGETAYTATEPEQLTHQRPVMDAGGVPIELGDDLYSVEGGLKIHVSTIDRVNCRIATSAMFALDKWADPSMFTHTKPGPDTWERIEGDTTLDAAAYCDRRGIAVEEGHSFVEPMARDLVRRCREVAERERGE